MMSESRGLSRPAAVLSWILQLGMSVILGQSLFFKFTGAPEAVYIFQTLGMEPWGRYATGLAELVTVVLLLMPRTCVYGAMLAVVVIAGAIGAHLTKLGIVVEPPGQPGDRGLLFSLALNVFVAGLIVIYLRRRQIIPRWRRVSSNQA